MLLNLPCVSASWSDSPSPPCSSVYAFGTEAVLSEAEAVSQSLFYDSTEQVQARAVTYSFVKGSYRPLRRHLEASPSEGGTPLCRSDSQLVTVEF